MNNEETKEKINAINNRSRAKLGEIIEIASKACVDTSHPGGYEPGQYGQDYRTFGAAICKIRQICKKGLSGDFPDYEWMAGMMMHGEFKPERLAQEIEALASEKPIDDELHEAATEEPTTGATGVSPVASESTPTGKMPIGPATIPPGADGTPPAEATQQPELRPVRPQTLNDIGMTMDKCALRDENGKIVRIHYAGIRYVPSTRQAQLWEIAVAQHKTGDDGKASHITVLRDHERVFSGSAFFGLHAAADIAISMMIRKIIGDVAKCHRDHFRHIRNATAMTKAAQAGEVA